MRSFVRFVPGKEPPKPRQARTTSPVPQSTPYMTDSGPSTTSLTAPPSNDNPTVVQCQDEVFTGYFSDIFDDREAEGEASDDKSDDSSDDAPTIDTSSAGASAANPSPTVESSAAEASPQS